MTAVIAIVGRPNTGKSTLFNRLTRTRDAVVADRPGVTRDRQTGIGHIDDRQFYIIDTGGIGELEPDNASLQKQVEQQALQAMEEADAIIWLVDGREGLNHVDEQLAASFRTFSDRLYLAINKTEGHDPAVVSAEFYRLGLGNMQTISASRGDGVVTLITSMLEQVDVTDRPEVLNQPHGTRISLIGRPNVGKSTLINRIIGEERVLTCDHPGTTRDSIAIPFQRNQTDYVLIDTAGVRRKSRVIDAVEKISVVQSLRAIDAAQIVLAVLDASEAITDQDCHLIGIAHDQGRPVIVAVNKWDGIETYQRDRIKMQLDRKLQFLPNAVIHFISALHGSGVGKMMDSIDVTTRKLDTDCSSNQLSELLSQAVQQHAPPMVRGRRIKLRYAHLGGHNPFRIIVHGNQVREIPESYDRYLRHYFQKALRLDTIPVVVQYKQGDNPYAGRKNKLTDRQIAKRKRMISYNKRKK